MTAGGSPRRAMLLFAAFALSWVGVEEVLGRLLRQPYPLMQIVWCRYASHLLLLFALCLWSQPARLWRTSRLTFHLLRSLCMVVMPLSFVLALQAGAPGATIWAVFWAAPVLILAIVWRGWRGSHGSHSPRVPAEAAPGALSWWIAAACTLAGVLMYWPLQGSGPASMPILGLLAALAMALSFAVYVVMTRSLRGEAVQANLFYTAIGVFALLTPFMPAVWVMPSRHDAAVLFCIGALGLVSLWLLDRAAAAAPLTQAVPGLYAYLPMWASTVWWWQGAAVSSRWVAAVGVALGLAWLWQRLPRDAAVREAVPV